MMYRDETLWRRLMGKLVDVLGSFAVLQVAAGARIIWASLFDSCGGRARAGRLCALCGFRYSRALIERDSRGQRKPVIHFGTGAASDFSANCTQPAAT